MEICIQNVARWDDPRVAQCGSRATVVVRETRSASAAKVLGKPFTFHKVCANCATVLTRDSRFLIA